MMTDFSVFVLDVCDLVEFSFFGDLPIWYMMNYTMSIHWLIFKQ